MLYIMHDADEDEMQPGLTCDMCGQFLVGFTLELPGKHVKLLSQIYCIHNYCAISFVLNVCMLTSAFTKMSKIFWSVKLISWIFKLSRTKAT